MPKDRILHLDPIQQISETSVFDKIFQLADVVYEPHDSDFSKFEFNYVKLSFQYCQKLIAHHSKTFNLASSLLDEERKNAVASLYGFCRITDDIIDTQTGHAEYIIDKWRNELESTIPDITDPVLFSWNYTRQKYHIPFEYSMQLIKGVKMDCHKKNYSNFEELVEYCYYVASTVGLMSMHIIGFKNREAIKYSIVMGVALQLTNIIRDVGEDYEMGRIYIPQVELDYFNVTKEHFENKIIDDAWKNLMAFQIERTRNLYAQSWKGLKYLEAKGSISIAAAATLYKEILKMVERNGYDNLNKRAFVSKKRKLYLLSKLLVLP